MIELANSTDFVHHTSAYKSVFQSALVQSYPAITSDDILTFNVTTSYSVASPVAHRQLLALVPVQLSQSYHLRITNPTTSASVIIQALTNLFNNGTYVANVQELGLSQNLLGCRNITQVSVTVSQYVSPSASASSNGLLLSYTAIGGISGGGLIAVVLMGVGYYRYATLPAIKMIQPVVEGEELKMTMGSPTKSLASILPV